MPPVNHGKHQGAFGEEVMQLLQRSGYKLGKTIGEGSYCKRHIQSRPRALDGLPSLTLRLQWHDLWQVKVAYRNYESGYSRRCACKMIDRRHASDEFVSKFLPREISILRTIRHPHVVNILDIVDVQDQVFIFMDLCERGDLLEHIRSRGPLSEARARLYFRQLVSAVAYLHSLDISHRDLKCENVLLANKECVKIADFGFARWCRDESGRRVLSDTFCGSAAYAAPEILQGTPYNPKMYDSWSLGCVLYIMLTATMPFDDSNMKHMLRAQLGRRLCLPCSVSSSARHVVAHLLEPDVTRRATLHQLAKDKWITPDLA